MKKTYSTKPVQVKRQWYLIDAQGQTLGRLASFTAKLLTGKTKPTYTPHVDEGDYVVIINAGQVKLTGNKRDEKLYRHSGYIGGIKSVSKGELLDTNPVRLLEHAVSGMVPTNKLKKQRMARLKINAGDSHEHTAQKPKLIEVKS